MANVMTNAAYNHLPPSGCTASHIRRFLQPFTFRTVLINKKVVLSHATFVHMRPNPNFGPAYQASQTFLPEYSMFHRCSAFEHRGLNYDSDILRLILILKVTH